MPPKRIKKGLTRMDAALDHMTAYGFSKPLIRKTLKDLLKLYGDEGWRFIEEDGYKVLLDVILNEQETENAHSLLEGASTSQHGNTGNELVTTVSNVVSVEALQNASTSQHENTGYELVTTESYGVSAEDASFQGSTNAESIQVRLISAQADIFAAVVNEECSKDVALDKKLIQSSPFYFSDDDHSEDKVSIPSTEHSTLLGSVCDKTRNPLKPSARRHKPCYGWIDENDDDDAKEPSFMSLEPAIQSFFKHA
ncbi:WIYLD domain-containing protein [Tanacetum coccineum]